MWVALRIFGWIVFVVVASLFFLGMGVIGGTDPCMPGGTC